MTRGGSLLAIVLLAVACASPLSSPRSSPAPPRAADYRPAELRQPALVVRLTFGAGDFGARDRDEIAAEYEGLLLDALNARGVIVRDTRTTVAPREAVTPAAALARAREVQADHAVLVDARVARQPEVFCRGTRRAFQTTATVWRQGVRLLRVSDGAVRMTVEEDRARALLDFEPDCEHPDDSRRFSRTETIAAAVDALVRRLLSP